MGGLGRLIRGEHAFDAQFLGRDGLRRADSRDHREIVEHLAVLDEADRDDRRRRLNARRAGGEGQCDFRSSRCVTSS